LDGENRREPRLAEYRYPEWDPAQGRLATGRALVIERSAPKGDEAALNAALAGKARLAATLERAFLTLAPSQQSWSGKSADGPELDINALVQETAEQMAGFSPRNLVFRRRLPRLRQISCGVLWDVSGSTRHNLEGGQPGGSGREQLKAAREALALFAQALTAAGDEFAIWAYSGIGPDRVDFYLLKKFEQAWDSKVRERLAGLKPLTQNRDGAAIRHATSLLAERASRQRLLIVITDGRPDDYAYGPEVAGRDLALALGAAKAAGVRPVAVLLSPKGRRPHEAYTQVPHIIIRELEGLARWLPRLYRKLTN
jgi:nitric oxide reductase activation protein